MAHVILTFDGEALDRFWLAKYVHELIAAERRRYPLIRDLVEVLSRQREVPRFRWCRSRLIATTASPKPIMHRQGSCSTRLLRVRNQR